MDSPVRTPEPHSASDLRREYEETRSERVLDDLNGVFVHPREALRTENLFRSAAGGDAAMIEQDYLIERGRHVEVVQYGDNRASGLAERAHDPKHHLLMADVQSGSRFIKEDERCLLGDRSSDCHTLTFTAREAGDDPVLEIAETERFERIFYGAAILLRIH